MKKRFLAIIVVALLGAIIAMAFWMVRNGGKESAGVSGYKPESKTVRAVLGSGYAEDLALLPGEYRVLGCLGGVVEILDLKTGKRQPLIKLKSHGLYQPVAVSPDGQKVLFLDNNDPYIFSMATGEKKLLCKRTGEMGFARLKDNRHLHYTTVLDGDWSIGEDGLEKHRLTVRGYGVEAWSPNGDRFLECESEVGNLCLVAADGQTKRKIADNVLMAVWFPQGERICCIRGEELAVIDLATGGEQTVGKIITKTPGDYLGYGGIAISPDGTKIAYVYGDFSVDNLMSDEPLENASEIYVYDLAAKRTYNVTRTQTQWEYNPMWLPGGKELLCQAVASVRETGLPVPVVVDLKAAGVGQ